MNVRSIATTLAGTALAASVVFAAAAHDYSVGDLKIAHPWATPPLGGRTNTAAYFVVRNTGETDDRLIGARSDAVETIEIHANVVDGDVVRMRKIDGIAIPAGGETALAPGERHLMLFGLDPDVALGDAFEMTLEFENAGEAVVTVNVESLADYLKAQGTDRTEDAAQHGAHLDGR